MSLIAAILRTLFPVHDLMVGRDSEAHGSAVGLEVARPHGLASHAANVDAQLEVALKVNVSVAHIAAGESARGYAGVQVDLGGPRAERAVSDRAAASGRAACGRAVALTPDAGVAADGISALPLDDVIARLDAAPEEARA